MWLWGVLFFIAICSQKSEAQTGTRCVTPSGEVAQCISAYSCSTLTDLIFTKDPEIRRYLKNSLCGWKGNTPLVCCGSPPYSGESEAKASTLLLGNGTCGYQKDFNKILGGTETNLEEFPWIALLVVTNNKNKVSLPCSGTLISKRYVLTAAHCFTLGTPVSVRLGEWKLSSPIDCSGGTYNRQCIEAVDMEVEEVIPHENYESSVRVLSNDIALIRLKEEVKFTDHIQPICLPENSEEKSNPDEDLWVSGWGKTELGSKLKSDIKQKVQVPIVPMSQCIRKFYKNGGIEITEKQLCAGGVIGKDACTGDSGGPLMATRRSNKLQTYIEGIVSFSRSCGTDLPAVYTRVSAYLGWIKRNIRE